MTMKTIYQCNVGFESCENWHDTKDQAEACLAGMIKKFAGRAYIYRKTFVESTLKNEVQS